MEKLRPHRMGRYWAGEEAGGVGRGTPPTLLTQRVGNPSLHAGRADVADAVLVLWLDQHSHLDVPQRLHGNLGAGYRVPSVQSSATVGNPSLPARTAYCSCRNRTGRPAIFFLRSRRETDPPIAWTQVTSPKGSPMDQKNSQSSCVPQGHHNVQQDSLGWCVRRRDRTR